MEQRSGAEGPLCRAARDTLTHLLSHPETPAPDLRGSLTRGGGSHGHTSTRVPSISRSALGGPRPPDGHRRTVRVDLENIGRCPLEQLLEVAQVHLGSCKHRERGGHSHRAACGPSAQSTPAAPGLRGCRLCFLTQPRWVGHRVRDGTRSPPAPTALRSHRKERKGRGQLPRTAKQQYHPPGNPTPGRPPEK